MMHLKPMIFASVAMILFTLLISSGAQASEPKLLSTHGAWSTYSFTENGNKVCYMAATPIKEEGKYTRRGKVYALITHRPSEGSKDVFSYITGYPYKTGSQAEIKIDGRNYTLFTQDETAWTPDAESDKRLAAAIQKGATMIVKGTSRKGTLTTDTFSLKGSGAAYKAISKACGL